MATACTFIAGADEGGRAWWLPACWALFRLYDELVDADEALERVQSYYRLREKGGFSPETEEQKEQVRDWYRWVKGGQVRVAKRRGPAA